MSADTGLADVVIGDSKISLVNGTEGKLIYAGYTIEDLAANALFEEVEFLLWNDRLPNQEELDAFVKDIATHSDLPDGIITLMKGLPKDAHPMAVLRTVASAVSHYDPNSEDNTDKDIAQQKAIRLTGQLSAITAAWERIRNDQEPVAPRPDYNLAQNFVYMLKGEEPDEATWKAINVYLVLLAEHGTNASTFATRVTTATVADYHSAIVSGIGTLKGPAHGGANTAAMNQFIEIGSVDNVEAWFQKNVKEGHGRIMGIGHRVYKAPDPRGAILKDHARALANAAGDTTWFDIAEKLEDTARADDFFIERNLFPNVDYYSAIVLYTLGLPTDTFTPLFAMSRVAGWSAHIFEQMGGRLIRPRAHYVGEMDLPWVDVADR